MRYVSIPGRGGGYGYFVPQAILSQEHSDGLAPEECDVCGCFSCFFWLQAETNLRDRLTALFLATKTTNNPISLETYTTHIPKTAPSDVLDLEFLIAQSLNFEFTVWHAHRALWGIWLDLQVSIMGKFFKKKI